jgi:CheY-like chemotaxis protein
VTAIRVLLADDEPLVRSGLRAILESEPDLTVVGEADDGAAVVAEARRTRPDIVLMDVRMPRVDGIAATRQLGQFDGGGPAVIVVTTFRERRLRLRRAAGGGAGIPPQTLHRGGLHQRDPHGTRGRVPALSGRRPPARHPPWRAGRPRAGRGEPHRPGSRGPAAHRPGPIQRGDRGRAVPRRGDREDPRTQRAGQARRPGPRTSGHHGLRERLHPLKTPREVTAVRLDQVSADGLAG